MHYNVLKRDGKEVEFSISKISDAITKAFEATKTPYHPSVLDLISINVTSDFKHLLLKYILIQQ